MALGWWLYQRRVRPLQMFGMAISYGGVLAFGMELSAQGADAAQGALLVFGSTLSYAVYLVYSGELVRRLGALRLVGLASSVACVLCIGQFPLLRPLSAAAVAPS